MTSVKSGFLLPQYFDKCHLNLITLTFKELTHKSFRLVWSLFKYTKLHQTTPVQCMLKLFCQKVFVWSAIRYCWQFLYLVIVGAKNQIIISGFGHRHGAYHVEKGMNYLSSVQLSLVTNCLQEFPHTWLSPEKVRLFHLPQTVHLCLLHHKSHLALLTLDTTAFSLQTLQKNI